MAKEKNQPAAEEPQLEKISFHAAILQSDGTFFTETFETLDALVARLKELVDRDVSVFTFAGTKLQVSKAPFRHLLTPWGNKPLFEVPQELEPDNSGYLGVDPIHLSDPPQLKVPQSRGQGGGPDGFFEEDGGDAMGVFDDVLPDPDS